MRDLYQILTVPKDADQATIKKAYKKLALQHHPDRHPGDKTHEARFKEISAAYEVLGDEEKRALYDEFGEDALRVGFDAEQARAYKRFGGMGGGYGGGGFGGGEDFFSQFFRGGRRGPATARNRPRGPNVRSSITIDLLSALQGRSATISVRRPSRCPFCNGVGGTGKRACPDCEGTGLREVRQLGSAYNVACSTCGGSGEQFVEECLPCGGTGRTTQPAQLNVHLPQGVSSGQTLRLKGQGGEPNTPDGQPGDLLLEIQITPHPHLRREGQDLVLELPISVSEALHGGKISVPTPWAELKVNLPAKAQNGTRMRIKGHGVRTKGGESGDLYLVLRPTLPPADSEEAQAVYAQMEALYAGPVREGFAL